MDTPQTAPAPAAPERGWLLYDGECPLCTGLAEKSGRFLAGRGFSTAPLQAPWVALKLGLNPGEIPDEMKLLLRSGEIHGGHHALAQIARRIWWAWPGYALSRLPGMDTLCRRGYGWLADRRHLLVRIGGRAPAPAWVTLIRCGIAGVWLFHGLFGKILGFIPRHRLIVARILGPEHAPALTRIIGAGEVLMALWMASGIAPKRCAAAQTLLLIGMNTLEIRLARDLLLAPGWMVAANLALLSLAWISALQRSAPGCMPPR